VQWLELCSGAQETMRVGAATTLAIVVYRNTLDHEFTGVQEDKCMS
jgi:hypothetical protein